MPRPALPPTPGSSTDIKPKDGVHLSSLHLSFELPPPAIHDASRIPPADTSRSPPSLRAVYSPSLTASPGAAYPMQAADTAKPRRPPSSRDPPKDSNAFALPPPPTRSRKIIQMRPRPHEDAGDGASAKDSAKAGAKGPASAAKAPSGASAGDKGKKKPPSASSAAGRKIARKTAHSLIERRRRSKMNEEFAVLKSMIPACTGEMHKLAILQASIDYVRYLEDCVAKLKAQHDESRSRGGSAHNPLPPIREFHPTLREDPAAAGDVDMTDSDTASPLFTGRPDGPHWSSVSPDLRAPDSRQRQLSCPSSVSADHRHYGYNSSAGASPAFGPQRHGLYAPGNASASGSTVTSPALQPQSDLDQEATAALLMLNSDRRGANANGRGLSVRDLLST